jgi:hypothetical protein
MQHIVYVCFTLLANSFYFLNIIIRVLKGQGLKGSETTCSQVRERRSSVEWEAVEKIPLIIFHAVTE